MLLVRNLELKKFERDVKFIQTVLCAMYELFSRRKVKDVSDVWARLHKTCT